MLLTTTGRRTAPANPYFKEDFKLLSATDFIAELTQHLPPKGARYIRYYGLYSSRARDKAGLVRQR